MGEACPHFQSREEAHVRSIAGTIAHEVTETGEDDARLSDEDAAAAAQCMDFYEQRKASMIAEAVECPLGTPAVTELKETYLEIDDCQFEDARGTTAGYVDRVLLNWNFTRAEGFDWKFGRWHVEQADNNVQGLTYSLGLFRRYKTLQAIRFYFKQPLLNYITHIDLTRDNIVRIYLRVQVIVARAMKARSLKDFSMAAPYAGVCNFCRHIADCPKVSEFALEVAHKFNPLGVPANINPSLKHSQEDTSLLLNLSGTLKVWVAAIKRQITDRIIRGDAEIPSGHVIQESSKRSIVSLDKMKECALRYLRPEEWAECLEVGLGTVENKISENAPRGQKENTVKAFKEDCAKAGATVQGEKFSFLRPVSKKSTSN
jgi:Protein of unknown function (DUF2800)